MRRPRKIAPVALALKFVRALDVTAARRPNAKAEIDRFFDVSPDLMAVSGFDGLWRRVNRAFETCLGYAEHEVVGQPFMGFTHPDERQRVEEAIIQLMQGEQPIVVELSIVRKDGSYRRIEWTTAALLKEGMFYGVGRDVTERREAESELAASRRRIVAAADEARRRIERDLHDATQQRLVSLALAASAAEADDHADRSDLRAELSRIAAGLKNAVEELREISRGIHPAILSEAGLGPALRTLARRSAIPVDLDITTNTRLPEPIEAAAYFVTSEALTNAAKHAQASCVEVSLAARDGSLVLAIRDDGAGGADPKKGTGLVGLQDRVGALSGTITIDSPPGGGTSLLVTLPRDVEPTR